MKSNRQLLRSVPKPVISLGKHITSGRVQLIGIAKEGGGAQVGYEGETIALLGCSVTDCRRG